MEFKNLNIIENPKSDSEKKEQTTVIQEKVWQMERLVALYEDQEKGFSEPMLALKLARKSTSNIESAEVTRMIHVLEQRLSDFLIEFGKLEKKDQAHFGPVLRMEIGAMLQSIKGRNWELYAKTAQILNSYFSGMESVLSVISLSVNSVKGETYN